MTTRRAAWLAASLLALTVAAVLALAPISAHGVDCGTPLAPADPGLTDGSDGQTVTSTTCATTAQRRVAPAAVLAAVAALALVGVLTHARWIDTPLHRLGAPPST